MRGTEKKMQTWNQQKRAIVGVLLQSPSGKYRVECRADGYHWQIVRPQPWAKEERRDIRCNCSMQEGN